MDQEAAHHVIVVTWIGVMLKCRGQILPQVSSGHFTSQKARQTKLNLNRLLAHSEHYFEVCYKERGLTTGISKLPHDG